nr:MAG TPA: hypothetical protein [Caudoviricetes sp.]DAY86538.1 MAG TPA: hypothetical protein [Caudoviricetes sp.]
MSCTGTNPRTQNICSLQTNNTIAASICQWSVT